jgi:long-chain acyl-CoA synthetase
VPDFEAFREVVVNANVAQLLHDTADRVPDAVGLVDGDTRLTWAELDTRVDAMASGLVQRGLRSGERVALLSGNSIEFVVAYFAILRAGLVAVPLNPAYTAPEVAVLLKDSGASLLFTSTNAAPVAREAAEAVTACEVVTIGSAAWDAMLQVDAVLAEVPSPPDAIALLLFTSGTSGRPKGAMLSHGALRANLDMLRELTDPPAALPSDVTLGVLPLFHIYGLNTVLNLAVSMGARVVLLDRFDPTETLNVIQREGVTSVAGAPGMFQAWLQMPNARDALAGVRLFSSGGAPLPPKVLEAFQERIGKEIYEGYGMTETAPVVATTLVGGRPKAGSVGRPLPGVEVMLVDESGQEVEENDPGEVWVKGPTVFTGYWPDGAGGADDNGWFRSGDVAYIDDDGDLHVVDRRRELILVNGFNVYPREIELVIEAMPSVQEVAVVGIPDEATGEAVTAMVVPAAGETVTVAQVEEYCASRLARFKSPTTIRIVSELPHSATGKIAKGRLREVYGDDG